MSRPTGLARLEAIGPELELALLRQDFRRRLGDSAPRRIVLDAIAASDGQSLAERCAHADATTYLPDDILVKVDVASMAYGLECRAPLLDHLLAESQLPSPPLLRDVSGGSGFGLVLFYGFLLCGPI